MYLSSAFAPGFISTAIALLIPASASAKAFKPRLLCVAAREFAVDESITTMTLIESTARMPSAIGRTMPCSLLSRSLRIT
jgi:hypothetical protein